MAYAIDSNDGIKIKYKNDSTGPFNPKEKEKKNDTTGISEIEKHRC